MNTFQINKNIEIVCDTHKTRSGFKHTATLLVGGTERETEKICYYNRTWESYQYQSVLEKLVEKTTSLSAGQKKTCKKFLDNGARVEHDLKPLKTTATVALLGDIFCTTQKEKNDWKARMLKAGLENKGLIMPEDWDELSEDDKEKRLNNVIKHLKT